MPPAPAGTSQDDATLQTPQAGSTAAIATDAPPASGLRRSPRDPTPSTRRQRLALLLTSRTLRPILVLSKRKRAEEESFEPTGDDDQDSGLSDGESEKGNRDSEEPSPLKAHKEDPYEAEGFEPTRSISAQRRKVLVSSPQELPSFSPQWYKRFGKRLLGCGNCMLRNRKCRRENGHARCDACVKSGMSRCSDSFSIPEYLQVINYLEPLTVFSDRSTFLSKLFSNATLTPLISSVIASDYRECSPSPRARQLACTHERFRGGFQGKVIPGIDSVAEEEVEFYTKLFKTARKESERDTKARKGSAMDEEEGEEVRVIAVEEAEAPREPSPMQEDAPEPAAATISLDDAIAADEAGRDEFVEGSSGGGT
ncbi:hypothetical protein R3P38DRAFT_3194865 [Favolaschia claudopus]|uniref:Zn(2)-C6 fungal-type domain-containing protein n=1 Tax=Favolaschia claudopus TaxID=2862362 RepID=A0AAW0BA07_9AGAR